MVTPDVDLEGLKAAVTRQAAALPRAEITFKALGHSYAVVVPDMAAACAFSNRCVALLCAVAPAAGPGTWPLAAAHSSLGELTSAGIR